tara:strand:- start:296 stop:979 length:684 start_codon:yes stop_codon:yes gene_type:complete
MKICIFDIETRPQSKEQLQHVMPNFKADKRTKDPVKIVEQIEAKREAFMRDAALDPRYGEICAVGLKCQDMECDIMIGNDVDLLQAFWFEFNKLKQKYTFAGFNIFAFDLHFIINRTLMTGNAGYLPPELTDYREFQAGYPTFSKCFIDLIDTFKVFKYSKNAKTTNLDQYCKAHGIDGKNGEGSMFYKMLDEGKSVEANKYLKNDLMITEQLFFSRFPKKKKVVVA